jgi:hypothetical protein
LINLKTLIACKLKSLSCTMYRTSQVKYLRLRINSNYVFEKLNNLCDLTNKQKCTVLMYDSTVSTWDVKKKVMKMLLNFHLVTLFEMIAKICFVCQLEVDATNNNKTGHLLVKCIQLVFLLSFSSSSFLYNFVCF